MHPWTKVLFMNLSGLECLLLNLDLYPTHFHQIEIKTIIGIIIGHHLLLQEWKEKTIYLRDNLYVQTPIFS